MKRREFIKVGVAASAMAALNVSPGYAADPVRIGVLIPGSVADKGYMESAFLGYQGLVERFKGRVVFQLVENINYADMEQVFVQLASRNRFVVAVSGASQSAMTKVAKRFPNVQFSLCGGARLAADAPHNIAQYDARQAEIAYVAGAAAALLSKTGCVAYIGGAEIPSIVNSGKEFENGAKSVNASIKVIQTLTGNFDDVAKAKEATLAAAGQGADVGFHILNRGLQGFEQAARERHMKIIGGVLPRCGVDPIYAAFTKTDVGYLLSQAVDAHLGNTWQAGSRAFGLKAGPQASDLVLCGSVEASVSARLGQIKQDIVAGKIVTLEG
jgi:basic membrane protein A